MIFYCSGNLAMNCTGVCMIINTNGESYISVVDQYISCDDISLKLHRYVGHAKTL